MAARTSRSAAAVLATLLIAALAGCAERGTRIVVITIDTLRRDAFEAGGPMPLTRDWADEGVHFDRAYAATSSTVPTHASLLTGLHPWEHGVTRNGMGLPESVDTVAELLSAKDFETAAVVASAVLAEEAEHGLTSGFDQYRDGDWLTLGARLDRSDAREGSPPSNRMLLQSKHVSSLAGEVNERAFAALDAMTAERQFLWVHYFDPHAPYGDAAGLGPEAMGYDYETRAEARRAHRLYRRDVAAVDRALAALRERLEGDRSRYETHVIVTADHGESFGEHGAIGHGRRVSAEQIRVPLFVVSPRVEPDRDDTPVGSVDVAATIFDLASGGAELGGGISLLDPDADERRVVGMRRTFPAGATERLLGGAKRPLARFRFYAVEGEQVYRGSARGVSRGPDGAPAPRRISALFGGFQRELRESRSRPVTDSWTWEAMEALGYVRGPAPSEEDPEPSASPE